jgi:hypothetical protein
MTTQSNIFEILNGWAWVTNIGVKTQEPRSSCPCSSVVPARLVALRHLSALGRQRGTLPRYAIDVLSALRHTCGSSP